MKHVAAFTSYCHQTLIKKGPGWIQREVLDWTWVKQEGRRCRICTANVLFNKVCEWKDDGSSERIVLDSKQGPGRFGVCTVSNITGFLVKDTNLLVFVWIRCDCAQTAFPSQRRQGPDNWCEALSNCSFIFSCATLKIHILHCSWCSWGLFVNLVNMDTSRTLSKGYKWTATIRKGYSALAGLKGVQLYISDSYGKGKTLVERIIGVIWDLTRINASARSGHFEWFILLDDSMMESAVDTPSQLKKLINHIAGVLWQRQLQWGEKQIRTIYSWLSYNSRHSCEVR